MDKNEFTNELEDLLKRIHKHIEENHEISFAASYDGEMNYYTFEFSDEKGYSPELADMFVNRLRELTLQAYEILTKEKIDENPDPMTVIVTILQLVAHKLGETKE